MRTHAKKLAGMAMLLAVLALGTLSCSDDDPATSTPPPGGGSSSLVASSSSPADGDATLTATATYTVNSGGTGFDELNVSEAIGATGHEVTITWDTTTHVVNSVQYAWGPAAGGPTSGFTQCAPGAHPCDPAKVTVDVPGTAVTITGLTIPDAFAGSSVSTLSGTARW